MQDIIWIEGVLIHDFFAVQYGHTAGIDYFGWVSSLHS
tara:strand:- start:1004 stop:1117 length:114 start_codon:yes stop_codon:yes gene_type:complete